MGERELPKVAEDQADTASGTNLNRRSFVRTATVGGVTAAALAATGLGAPAFADAKGKITERTSQNVPTLVDAGAGMHAGMSTVQMMGIASISRQLVTCAVGQFGLTLSELPLLAPFLNQFLGGLLGPGWSGPFAMEMYSLDVKTYDVNHAAGVIRAKGVVRSITKIGGVLIENATAPYLAVATDGSRNGQPDTYYLSFTTPFWATPGNPLATPSTFHKGWSMFGGDLIVGEISVTK